MQVDLQINWRKNELQKPFRSPEMSVRITDNWSITLHVSSFRKSQPENLASAYFILLTTTLEAESPERVVLCAT